VELGGSQTTKRRMPIARWIPKATSTHSEYVIVISFEIMVARTRLYIRFYVYCLIVIFLG